MQHLMWYITMLCIGILIGFCVGNDATREKIVDWWKRRNKSQRPKKRKKRQNKRDQGE